MNEELKPCRKCGSDKVFIESTIAGFTLLYYARCYECNHMGNYKNRPHEAVEAWNSMFNKAVDKGYETDTETDIPARRN